jgi:CopG family nickel-responsive transcriptional regulator
MKGDGVVAEKFVRFGITVPQDVLNEFDQKLKLCGKRNRSDVLRQLMRSHIAAESWQKENGQLYGTITLMYDHHSSSLVKDLTSLQHNYGAVIVCTTHVHVTHDTCLECIVLRGDASMVKAFVNVLERIKGIQNFETVVMGQ